VLASKAASSLELDLAPEAQFRRAEYRLLRFARMVIAPLTETRFARNVLTPLVLVIPSYLIASRRLIFSFSRML